MPRIPSAVLPIALILLGLAGAGCGTPAALQQSQRLQLDAMIQYRDEMAAYHQKMTDHLAGETRAQLDAALAASLQQAADADGRLAVEAALEKAAKRLALEDAFRTERARLDGEFAQRQAAIGRAIDLAQDTLGLIAEYGRLGELARNLFVREREAQQLLTQYETENERSARDE